VTERRRQASHPPAVKPELLADTITNQHIQPGQLTIHADRGSSMAPSRWRSYRLPWA
jgi:hypothetical protein